jgi:hypothetical protein
MSPTAVRILQEIRSVDCLDSQAIVDTLHAHAAELAALGPRELERLFEWFQDAINERAD